WILLCMHIMNVQDYLSNEEIKSLSQRSDWKASWEIFKSWALIALSFVVAGFFPNFFTFLLAIIILGSRQLACAIIMHDASHRALFRSPGVNDLVGNWLGGYLVFNDARRYRPYHIQHHVNAGTHKDPDLSLVQGYPTTVMSFIRKMSRDLFGLTGIKTQVGVYLMNFEHIKYTAAPATEKIDQSQRSWWSYFRTGFHHYWKPITANFFLWLVLWGFGAGWLYLLWVVALLTTFNISLRIRAIAEHSMVPDQLDPHCNTRTTYARWWEKLLFAPHNVNYHAEHHLLMSVPPYHLPRMHRLLKERGFYDKGVLAQSYWEVIKKAVSKKTAPV
ncbi:MAG: fatty acid desaturase family protein, partial [Bacteroidota bacterium]